MLQVSLPARDVYNLILQPLNIFTDVFKICHKQMLMYDYIKLWQLSINKCVIYKQCLNSLRTALVHVSMMLFYVTFEQGVCFLFGLMSLNRKYWSFDLCLKMSAIR